MNMESLPEEDRIKLMKTIDEVQTNVSMQTMYVMVEKCFGTCVETFRRKSLDKGEERVRVCVCVFCGGCWSVWCGDGDDQRKKENTTVYTDMCA